MADQYQDNESKYMSWLAVKVSPAQLSELYVTYKSIEEECKKARVIKNSLFENMSFTAIGRIRSTIEGSKLFRFFHKKDSGKIAAAIRYMQLYVKESEEASKLDKNNHDYSVHADPNCESSEAVSKQAVERERIEDSEPAPHTVSDAKNVELNDRSPEERVREVLRQTTANNRYGEPVSYIAKKAGVSRVEAKKILDAAPWAKRNYNYYISCEPTVEILQTLPAEEPVKTKEVSENEHKEQSTNAPAESKGLLSVNYLLVKEMAFTQPVMLSYFGDRFPVNSWKDTLIKACRLLIDDYPQVFEHLRNQGMLPGTHPVWIVDKSLSCSMKKPREICPDYFIETNRNTTDIVRIIRHILNKCRVDYENLVIYYRRLEVSSPETAEDISFDEPSGDTQADLEVRNLSPELAKLLDGDEYECLRNELRNAGILTLKQFLNIRPYAFLNEHNLYPFTRRQAIYSDIRRRIRSIYQPESDAEVADSHDLPVTQEEWLLAQIKTRNLTYQDKRAWDGCLWIVGGHELDDFIQRCVEHGYVMAFKADGCKCFPQKPVWWTKSRLSSQFRTRSPLDNNELDTPSLGAFRAFLIHDQLLAERTASNYCAALRMIEDYIQRNHLDVSILNSTSANVQMIVDHLLARPDFVKINDDRHHQFSAALAQYIAFLTGDATKDAKGNSPQGLSAQPVEDEASFCPKAEELVLKADLDGLTVEMLSQALNLTVAKTNRIVARCEHIVQMPNRLVHENAFVDWEEAADKLEEIIEKLLARNNGYISAAQLFEYVRAEMQMFLNDNDIDDARTVFDIAEHLFSKNAYHEKKYSFQSKTHISPAAVSVASILDVAKNFGREHGGVFVEDDLVEYMHKVGLKTGNLRLLLQIYDKPIFLFYDVHTYMFAESMNIDASWLADVSEALDRLFADMGDHIVLKELPSLWLSQLPALPLNKPWTVLLLQSVLMHYSSELGGARTIAAVSGQAGDTIQAVLVSGDSQIHSFADAVAVMLYDTGKMDGKYETEELRQLLVQWNMIGPNDLYYTLPKALANDSRFAWSADGSTVIVKVE